MPPQCKHIQEAGEKAFDKCLEEAGQNHHKHSILNPAYLLAAVGVMLVCMEIILLLIGFSREGEYIYTPKWWARLTRKKKKNNDP